MGLQECGGPHAEQCLGLGDASQGWAAVVGVEGGDMEGEESSQQGNGGGWGGVSG